MAEDDGSRFQPKGLEIHAELLGKIDEPKVGALRRLLKALEREALHSHAMPDELARALFISTLQDCHRALDGEIVGATPQLVTEILASFSASLTRSESKVMRQECRSSS